MSGRSDRRSDRRRIKPAIAVGGLMVGVVLFVAFVVPLLPGYDPSRQDLQAVMQHPRQGHLLGTDPLGRDIFSRLSVAVRTSLGVIGVALAINIVIGVGLGTIAGYFGGLVESVIMGLADLQLSIPLLILLVTVISVVGPSATTLAVVIGLSYWIGYGRVCRVIAASLRNREFVLAARTQGAGAFWIMRTHILPQIVPQLVILGTFDIGVLAVLEASLSYLGLGIQAPTPSLGGMIFEGQQYLSQDPWLTLVPAAMIFLLVGGDQILSGRLTPEGENTPAAAVVVTS